MPATRATRRNQAISPGPSTSTIAARDVAAASLVSKGRRAQPAPVAPEHGYKTRSQAANVTYTSDLHSHNVSVLTLSQPSPPTLGRIPAPSVAHTTGYSDSGEEELTEHGTPPPSSPGSSRVGSSAEPGIPRKRKRSIDNGHIPTPKWLVGKVRVVTAGGPYTLLRGLPRLSQARLDDKDEEIRQLKKELEDLRRAFDDLQLAKTTLAKEVHRLHQRSTEDSEMFAGMNVEGGRGDSKGYQRMLKRDGLGEIPALLPLPAQCAGGEVVDMPPVMVMGDHIDLNRVRIRLEEPIGAGAGGKIIAGTILNDGTKGDEIETVAIKAMMKSGFAQWDKELFREARALQSLGQCGIAPKMLAAIETPLRFLTIMERYPMCLWNLDTYLRNENISGCLDADVIQILAKKLTVLLSKLHATNQVHRDFKPENVLIGETGEMVLADFGSIGVVGEKHDGGNFGTEGFMAPYADPRRREKNSTDMDIWSLGATILWLGGEDLKEKGPLSEKECQEAVERRFPKAEHPQAHAFVSRCLAFPGPGRRCMTARRALNHPWMKEVASAETEANLSLSIWEAADSTQSSLRENTEQYFLNIGVGACRELEMLD